MVQKPLKLDELDQEALRMYKEDVIYANRLRALRTVLLLLNDEQKIDPREPVSSLRLAIIQLAHTELKEKWKSRIQDAKTILRQFLDFKVVRQADTCQVLDRLIKEELNEFMPLFHPRPKLRIEVKKAQ
ncbi:hypothetical protein KW791_04075 [Candidatus Parcubacteria bacterium]|nr:hypothetical protein [Candidatus Parcubacteria bacterium]